jgi:hypothetical protein
LRASASKRPICKLVGRSTEPTINASLSIDAVDLFSKEPHDDSCDGVAAQDYILFFIPLPGETNNAANVGYEPLRGDGYGTRIATFTLYTILPNAPSNLKPRTGVAAIGVGFEPLPGATAHTGYKTRQPRRSNCVHQSHASAALDQNWGLGAGTSGGARVAFTHVFLGCDVPCAHRRSWPLSGAGQGSL